MSFLDDVSKLSKKVCDSASKTANTIVDKSKLMAEKSKLKKQLTTEQNSLSKEYFEIGKKFYSDNKENVPDAYGENFASVQVSIKNIASLEKQIEELDNIMICPKCGNSLNKDQMFCQFCGTKMQATDETQPTDDTTVDSKEEIIQIKAEDIEIK